MSTFSVIINIMPTFIKNPFHITIFPFQKQQKILLASKIHSEVSYEINIRRRALGSMERTSEKSLLRAYNFPALMGKRDFADK